MHQKLHYKSIEETQKQMDATTHVGAHPCPLDDEYIQNFELFQNWAILNFWRWWHVSVYNCLTAQHEWVMAP